MVAGYYAELDPAGDVEQTLFDEVAAAAWQLRRLRRMETALCTGQASYRALLDDETLLKKMDRLSRHHTRIERTFHRCLKELKAAIAARHREARVAEINRQFNPQPIAAPQLISERTQSVPVVDAVRPVPESNPLANPASDAPAPLWTDSYDSEADPRRSPNDANWYS